MSGNKNHSEKSGFGLFASKNVILGIIIAMGCLWIFSVVISFFTGTPEEKSPYKQVVEQYPYLQKADQFIEGMARQEPVSEGGNEDAIDNEEGMVAANVSKDEIDVRDESGLEADMVTDTHDVSVFNQPKATVAHEAPVAPRRVAAPNAHAPASTMTTKVIGVAFVDALIDPMQHELDSFWGWRPNDLWITKLGRDNRENYQRGVWEVTRRTAVILAERIARTGSNVSFNKYLNDAANRFTRNPDSFWFPSAESEYEGAIKNLNKYKDQLVRGEENFYTRPDNVIPLLVEFRTRLGDCDDKLVRKEGNLESQVSTFEADDRFYYAQGVASAILPLLEAIQHDFGVTLETRSGMEPLHRAIEALREASHLSPWIVLEGDYDGLLANQRANMSTFVSHARFYIGVLIKTLST